MRFWPFALASILACAPDNFSTNDGGEDGAADVVGEDVRTDAGDSDGKPIEASTDAPADGSNLLFSCLTPPVGTLLCDDWESSSSVSAGWGNPLTSHGEIRLDSLVSVSPTHSFQASIAADAGAAYSFAQLLFQYQSNTTIATLTGHAAIRIHSIDPAQPTTLMQVGYAANSNATPYGALKAFNNFIVLGASVDGVNPISDTAVDSFMPDVWYVIELSVTPSPNPSITVRINGVLKATVTPQLPSPNSLPLPTLNLGLVDPTGVSPSVVNYDNCLFINH